MSLPLHRRSRSSACWSWGNGYKRTWALLFSSDWVTILPACRMQLVKENIALNTGTSHLPPPGVWRPTTQSWNPSLTWLSLAPTAHCLSQIAKCHGEDAQFSCRILATLWWGWQNRAPLSIRSLVAKETNAPNTCYTTLIMRVFFFLLLHNYGSVYSSLHTLPFTSNYYPNVHENTKGIYFEQLGKLRILPFSANVMERLDSLSSYLIIVSF